MCDVHFRDNSPPLDISNDQFEDFSDSIDDSTSIDDDCFSIDDINYVKASHPDSKLVSLKEDDILHEKLLNIHLLIDKIESLNDNPTPDRVLKSPSIFPIPVECEDLVLIPSESEGIPDNMCDVPFLDNSPPLDISNDQFEDFSDSNDDSTSIDDDCFSIDDINYVKASPPDSKL
nr:hypothetical protein [Tanacetum cinerariifolium]